MKKVTALVLTVVLLASLSLSGCGQGGGAAPTGDGAAPAGGTAPAAADAAAGDDGAEARMLFTAGGPTTFPLVEGGATLTIATGENWFTPASFADGLPAKLALEELTGVTIDWQVIPQGEYAAVMQTRLAAVIDLPDIFNNPGGGFVDRFGVQGLAINLSPLIEDHAPYLRSLMEMRPVLRSALTAFDGNIYWYPYIGEGHVDNAEVMETGSWIDPGANINLHVPMIRQDWLDRLGLAVPVTLDDWTTVLRAFRDNDPRGDGVDVIPLTTQWGLMDLMSFGSGFGLYMSGNANSNSGFHVRPDGTVYHRHTEPAARDFISFLASWFAEGLIDPEFMVSNWEHAQEKVHLNIIGAVSSQWLSNMPSFNANLRAGLDPNANYVPVRQPVNAAGRSYTYNRWMIGKHTGITLHAENPELAMRWLDAHALSPQGINLQMWGVEGISYTVGPDGRFAYTDFVLNNPDGLGPFEAIRSLGAWGRIAMVQTRDAYVGLFAELPEILDFAASFRGDEVRNPFPAAANLPFTEDEAERFSDIMSNVNMYRDENYVRFIDGSQSMDEWDAYVDRLHAMGLGEALEMLQRAYDRFVAAN